MKQIVLFLSIAFFPVFVFASGPYDGIWQTSETEYSTVNQDEDTIIVVSLDLADGDFEVSSGELVGNEVTIVSVYGSAEVTARIVFNSLTTAVVTIVSCVPSPEYICFVAAGETLVATKVF